MRRDHPRWGERRIEFELGRQRLSRPGPVAEHDLSGAGPARPGRPGPAPPSAGGLQALGTARADGAVAARHRRRRSSSPTAAEAKVVTGVDDHSRYCVIAAVVRRATGRAVCLAFAAAMRRYGIPDEVLTDNGKQFTGRFNQPRPAEVMFERICRENGIVARNTKPRTPTTTGKVERFHQSLQTRAARRRRAFGPTSPTAQAAIDAFRGRVQHQPAAPVPGHGVPRRPVHRPPRRRASPLRLPAALTAGPRPTPRPARRRAASTAAGCPAPLVVSANGVDPVNLAVEIDPDRCPPRGTWPSAGNSSGSAPTGPAPRSRCGPTPPSCTCSSTGSGSRPSRPGSPSPSCAGCSPRAADPAGPPPHPHRQRARRPDRGRPARQRHRPDRPGRPATPHRLPLRRPARHRPPRPRRPATRRPTASCCAACPTRSPRPSWPASATPDPPAHHPAAPEPRAGQRRVSCRGAIIVAGQRIHVGIGPRRPDRHRQRGWRLLRRPRWRVCNSLRSLTSPASPSRDSRPANPNRRARLGNTGTIHPPWRVEHIS